MVSKYVQVGYLGSVSNLTLNILFLTIFDSIFGKYLSREDEERNKWEKLFKESILCQNTVENWQKFGNQFFLRVLSENLRNISLSIFDSIFRNISPEKMRKEKVENYLRKVSSVKILSKIGREIFLEENCWKLISKGGYSRNQEFSIFDSFFGKYLSREDEERRKWKKSFRGQYQNTVDKENSPPHKFTRATTSMNRPHFAC